MRKSIITVLAALTASLASPAAAEAVSVTVTFDDLDLTTESGLATLDKRIAAAVRRVCTKVGARDLGAGAAWQECKAASLADAMKQLSAIAPAESVALAASSQN